MVARERHPRPGSAPATGTTSTVTAVAIGSPAMSVMPPMRMSWSRNTLAFHSACSAGCTCCKSQPPQRLATGHGGVTRNSDGVITSVVRANRMRPDLIEPTTVARTVSPGSAPRTNTVASSVWATQEPPAAGAPTVKVKTVTGYIPSRMSRATSYSAIAAVGSPRRTAPAALLIGSSAIPSLERNCQGTLTTITPGVKRSRVLSRSAD